MFKWTCWPQQRLSSDERADIEGALRDAIGAVEYEERLIKSATAPIYMVLTWVAGGAGSGAIGWAVGKGLDALAAVAARRSDGARSEPMTLGFVADLGDWTIEVYAPTDAVAESRSVSAAFRMAQEACSDNGINSFGVEMVDMFGQLPPVPPGGRWPARIRRVVFSWNPAAKRCDVTSVEAPRLVFQPRARGDEQ